MNHCVLLYFRRGELIIHKKLLPAGRKAEGQLRRFLRICESSLAFPGLLIYNKGSKPVWNPFAKQMTGGCKMTVEMQENGMQKILSKRSPVRFSARKTHLRGEVK